MGGLFKKKKPSSNGGFAPAFGGPVRNPSEGADNAPEYHTMYQPEIKTASTWNTFDPEANKFSSWTGEETREEGGESTLKPGVWNRWGHGDQAHGDGDDEDDGGDKNVADLFRKDHEIMDDNRGPRNEFEKRNQQALGLGRKSNAIVNYFGDTAVSTVKDSSDERLRLLDRNNQYIDGKHRGQLPKRLLDERARLLELKDAELSHACAVLREWAALSPNEQFERLQKAQRDKDALLELLTLEIEQAIPRAYEIDQEESLFVDYEDDGAILDARPDEPSEPTQKKRRSNASLSWALRRHAGRGYQPYARRGPRPRAPASVASESRFSVMIPDLESLDTERSKLEVTKWPLPVPFVDLDKCPPGLTSGVLSQEQVAMYQHFLERCSRRPRLVTVTLHPEVKFTSEALVSRLFGGPVQEIQFFPDNAQALVLFIKPQDAATFIHHIHNARGHSPFEYRQLQIAAEWHRGDWHEAKVRQTKYVSRVALFDQGSRALCIDDVNPRFKQEGLLGTFKRHLGSDNQVVRCKLVRPPHQASPRLFKSTKLFEQGEEGPNQVLLEFASTHFALPGVHVPPPDFLTGIKQAATAKDLFARRAIKDMGTAKYMRDPISDSFAWKPWCKCDRCKLLGLPTDNQSLASAALPASEHTAAASTGSRRTVITDLSAAMQASKDGSLDYDAKRDAQKPAAYEERFHKRPDLGYGRP